jgi:hypothetical protein
MVCYTVHRRVVSLLMVLGRVKENYQTTASGVNDSCYGDGKGGFVATYYV